MKKQHYLTLVVFTAPCFQSNVRGESDGNRMTLQKITLGQELRTLLSGVSLRWAIRDALMANQGDENFFRHHHAENTLSGYSYGPNRSPSIKAGIRDTFLAGKTPADYEDHDFGFMVVETDVVNNDISKGQYKSRASVLLGDGISLSPFGGESTFHQGVNPKDKEEKDGTVRGGDIAPYSMERHFSRYAFRVTFNLDGIPLHRMEAIVRVILDGLQVGGGHTRAESEIVPEAVLWRFYNAPGSSGMYRPQYKASPSVDLDLGDFFQAADKRGIILNSAGTFTGQTEGHPEPLLLRDLVTTLKAKAAAFKE